ncbi:MAG: membrane protein insertase YidC [Clostridia bacterium]|nr:membrane protein insertase YidC [Clostridia bacterium]
MKSKQKLTLALVAMLALSLVLFTGCARQQITNIFDYSDENLGLVGNLIRWMHSWIGNYGWTVVVFTVFLKLFMLPLDFWQRYTSRQTSLKTQKIQPLIEDIDKRFGKDTQRAQQEKNKLYQKYQMGGLTMCLPMIITMVVFFYMFGGLTNYSTYSSVNDFKALSQQYYDSFHQQFLADDALGAQYQEIYDQKYQSLLDAEQATTAEGQQVDTFKVEINAKISAVEEMYKLDANKAEAYKQVALDAVANYYQNHHESWLWLQNIWQPDTWAPIMPTYEEFTAKVTLDNFGSNGRNTYNAIRETVLSTSTRSQNGSWNGLMILPLLSVGLSFLSMFISQKLENKKRQGDTSNTQQQTQNKMMLVTMPLMMAVFGFMYTGAFAIYMVANYAISILSTLALRAPVEKLAENSLRKMELKDGSGKASYMR